MGDPEGPGPWGHAGPWFYRSSSGPGTKPRTGGEAGQPVQPDINKSYKYCINKVFQLIGIDLTTLLSAKPS